MIDIEIFQGKYQKFLCIDDNEVVYTCETNDEKTDLATDFISAAVKLVGKDEAIKIMEGE